VCMCVCVCLSVSVSMCVCVRVSRFATCDVTCDSESVFTHNHMNDVTHSLPEGAHKKRCVTWEGVGQRVRDSCIQFVCHYV